MEQKSCLRLVYKIHTKQLKRSNWDLHLPLPAAMKECPEVIVSLNDSQLLRWIDEINGITDINGKVHSIQVKIAKEKKKPKSRETKTLIRELYKNLYALQFQPDYLCVVMDSMSDYDRANGGFKINGIEYRRFLGTNGGIKNSTIVYVNKELYPELKQRLDNGRKDVELVPAKLEAYQALVCSGSTPIPQPRGFIVVRDCITHFKDNVILINDESDGEPVLTYENDYEIEHNGSDGFGLMLPSYSRKVNEYLTGEDSVLSGMNTRYSFEKGMLFSFPFIDFAEKVAGTYLIKDVWGDWRDVRDADIIFTESMIKLWQSYDNYEDYVDNCKKNNYQLATTKITPDVLENVRNTNYQFLQSYQFTDEELKELCQPTIDEISGVLGMDYRKSIVFLAGFGLNEKNSFDSSLDKCIRALMIDRNIINDSFVRKKIWNMIAKRIEMAKRGVIKVNGNYVMIGGDPYALCQSMFGLEVTGLLKAGEIYHAYWNDHGAKEVACFRAPMTCHNNIRKMKLNQTDEAKHWFQYIKTASILNVWDTTCEAMNGQDFDGDTNMCTDNPILVNNTLNTPTIICMQRKAEKKIVTEEDIIKANKLAFNDDIGTVTNRVTSMIEVQAGYTQDSEEYKTLEYRIMCGQAFQQNVIDRAKGIIAKPMPESWFSPKANRIKDDDSDEVINRKIKNERIVASRKPYFMTYVYPKLKSQNTQYINNNNYGVAMRFFSDYGLRNMDDLINYKHKTAAMKSYLEYYEKFLPTGNNACVVNRICWIFEDIFRSYGKQKLNLPPFDYDLLKSHVDYSKNNYNEIKKIYKTYCAKYKEFTKQRNIERIDEFESYQQKAQLIQWFRKSCEEICTNEDELCDIIIDVCYQTESGKSFAWDICGNVMLRNLLAANDNTICYPEIVDNGGDFEYCGEQFRMTRRSVSQDELNNLK